MFSRKFLAVLLILPFSGELFANDNSEENQYEMEAEESDSEASVQSYFSSESFALRAACGDARLISFYEEASVGFENGNAGKVKIKFGSGNHETRFQDVSCINSQPYIQFENGGTITITSYFGGYLPSPTGSTVQAYLGNINIPGVLALNDVRFWLNVEGDIFGLLIAGPTFFQMSSSWWTLN